MMKNGVFYFGIIFSHSRDIQVFVQKLITSQTVHDCNKSQNFGWVLFKFGSCNLRQVRQKWIASVLLPWQPLLLLGLFNARLILSFIIVIRHVHSR